MKEHLSKKWLTAALTAACALMLLLTGYRLLSMLSSPADSMSRRQSIVENASTDGLFGMVLIDIDDTDAAAYYHVPAAGVYVLAVESGSRAELAGVRSGDCILSVNGAPVATSGEVQDGDWDDGLSLLLLRDGQQLSVLLDTGAHI